MKYDTVYPPSDDTFLMIDHIVDKNILLSKVDELFVSKSEDKSENSSQDIELYKEFNVIEIGSGSGMISTAVVRGLISKMKNSNERLRVNLYCTDKNPDAVRCTNENLMRELESLDFTIQKSSGRSKDGNVVRGTFYAKDEDVVLKIHTYCIETSF